MTPLDVSEAAFIEVSRIQMLTFESPYERRMRVLMDAGLSEDEAERILANEVNETKEAA